MPSCAARRISEGANIAESIGVIPGAYSPHGSQSGEDVSDAKAAEDAAAEVDARLRQQAMDKMQAVTKLLGAPAAPRAEKPPSPTGARKKHYTPDMDQDDEVWEEESADRPEFNPDAAWPAWRLRVRRFVRSDVRFDRFILAAVLLCTVTLAIEDPTDTQEKKWTTRLVSVSDDVFTIIFSLEAALKMVGLGLCHAPWHGPDPPPHEGGYFRNWWNILDFVICVTGFFQLVGLDRASGADSGDSESSSFNGLRAFRLLRPLRAVSRFPSVRILVNSLLASLPRLSSVFVLYSVFIFVFGIIAVQVWQGRLRKRCVLLGVPEEARENRESVKSMRGRLLANASLVPLANALFPPDLRDQVCKDYPKGRAGSPESLVGGFYCPFGHTCVEVENPNYGQEHFDNIGAAALSLFVAVTMEGWSSLMYRIMDASSYTSSLFFVTLILFGSFFIINLTLVIINAAFDYEHSRELKQLRALMNQIREERERRKMRKSKRSALQARRVSAAASLASGGGAQSRRVSGVSASELAAAATPRHGSLPFLRQSSTGAETAGSESRLESCLGGLWQKFIHILRGTTDGSETRPGDLAEMCLDDDVWVDCRVTAVHTVDIPVPTLDAEEISRNFDVELMNTELEDRIRLGVSPNVVRVVPRNRLRRAVRRMLHHSHFNTVIIVCILLNAMALAVDHHGQSSELEKTLDTANVVFTVIFALECVLKLVGLGVWDYFSDGWNTFDALVVLVSLGELGFLGSSGNVSMLRALRILRVLKIARRFQSLQRWVKIILDSLRASFTLSVLICLLVFIYTLLGMQLMGNQFCGLDEDCEKSNASCTCVPRANFDNVGTGMLTMFQILTGEDWNQIMYNGMRATGPAVSIFFVTYFFVGNYLMLNLFVAIFLSQASQATQDAEKEGEQEVMPRRLYVTCPEEEALSGMYQRGRTKLESMPVWEQEEGARLYSTTGVWAVSPSQQSMERGERLLQSDEHAGTSPDKTLQWQYLTPTGYWIESRSSVEHTEEMLQGEDGSDHRLAPLMPLADDSTGKEAAGRMGQTPSFSVGPENALFCLSPMNPVRIQIIYMVDNPLFETVIVLVILLSTVTLAIENPKLPPDHYLNTILIDLDYGATAVFFLEAVIKVMAFGFIMHPTAYLRRDAWNVLDFFILVAALISYSFGQQGIDLHIFKIFRALRPLRFINKSTGLKVVVVSLIRSMFAMANVTVISGLIFVVCAIMGVQLFKGVFYQCTDQVYGDLTGTSVLIGNETLNRTYNLNLRVDCEAISTLPGYSTYRWKNYHSHFDHVGASLLTLFEVTTLEGWVTVMYLGMDGVDHDRAPVKNHQAYMVSFFILFIVVGSFFVVNLFVSVLLDSYYGEKKKRGGEKLLLSETQKKWMESYYAVVKGARKPQHFHYKRTSNLRTIMRRFVSRRWFEIGIQVCIALNIVVLATEYYEQPSWLKDFQDVANLVFILIFTVEAAIKLYAYGVKMYFESPWNRFDFIVVIISWVGFCVLVIGKSSLGTAVSVFRILRLARLLRMVRRAKGITVLLRTLLLSLPSMINVSGILAVIFFVFAVLGVKLFGKMGHGEHINRHANFENFPNAVLTLVRMATGEGWQGIMSDCRRRGPPDCSDRLGECGNDWAPITYFVLFSLCGMYVLLNLFIAVILDSFDEVVKREQKSNSVNVQHMRLFNEAWKRFDPERTFRLDVLLLPSFLRTIGPPLGVLPTATHGQAQEVIAELDIDVIEGKVDMQPLLQQLFCRTLGHPDDVDLPEAVLKKLNRTADKRFQRRAREKLYERQRRERDKEGLAELPVLPAHTAIALIKAQARFRGMLVRRRLQECKRKGVVPKPEGESPRFGVAPAKPAEPEGLLLRAKTALLRRMSAVTGSSHHMSPPQRRRRSRLPSGAPSAVGLRVLASPTTPSDMLSWRKHSMSAQASRRWSQPQRTLSAGRTPMVQPNGTSFHRAASRVSMGSKGSVRLSIISLDSIPRTRSVRFQGRDGEQAKRAPRARDEEMPSLPTGFIPDTGKDTGSDAESGSTPASAPPSGLMPHLENSTDLSGSASLSASQRPPNRQVGSGSRPTGHWPPAGMRGRPPPQPTAPPRRASSVGAAQLEAPAARAHLAPPPDHGGGLPEPYPRFTTEPAAASGSYRGAGPDPGEDGLISSWVMPVSGGNSTPSDSVLHTPSDVVGWDQGIPPTPLELPGAAGAPAKPSPSADRRCSRPVLESAILGTQPHPLQLAALGGAVGQNGTAVAGGRGGGSGVQTPSDLSGSSGRGRGRGSVRSASFSCGSPALTHRPSSGRGRGRSVGWDPQPLPPAAPPPHLGQAEQAGGCWPQQPGGPVAAPAAAVPMPAAAQHLPPDAYGRGGAGLPQAGPDAGAPLALAPHPAAYSGCTAATVPSGSDLNWTAPIGSVSRGRGRGSMSSLGGNPYAAGNGVQPPPQHWAAVQTGVVPAGQQPTALVSM
eukprot:TRINITY_DN1097_c0_g2_i1.p1 TRINITY_DN1097_c0_g2~~TRINITY_DN1097_c0_g2_i1.p1  ORF type:complete len:2446 (+),score=704.96 TRINITY_DN1097_c0_g2_i1:141-7478(+)